LPCAFRSPLALLEHCTRKKPRVWVSQGCALLSLFDPRLAGRRLLLGQHAQRLLRAPKSARFRAHEAFDTPPLSSAASTTLQPLLLVSVKVCFAGIYVPLLARTLTRHCLRHSSLTHTLQALVRGPARPRTPASHPPAPLEGGSEGTRSMPLPPLCAI
jgi:hypothetical protein